MTDLNEPAPIGAVRAPDRPVHQIHGGDAGKDLLDWTRNAAVPEVLTGGRAAHTIKPGMRWLANPRAPRL